MPKYLKKISKGMKDRGYNRDLQQYRMKLKELRQAYQRTREANGHSGSEPQTCRFYDELHASLGGAPTTTPALCVYSINGLSRNRDVGFGDEEEEEEKEVEAQQASGETVFPDSQELFLTLDLVPSQPTEGRLLDLEGGEGTSAVIQRLFSISCACHSQSPQGHLAAESGLGGVQLLQPFCSIALSTLTDLGCSLLHFISSVSMPSSAVDSGRKRGSDVKALPRQKDPA
ncbi:hypothetical protein UY3_01395 [Chelonia mydas]|uniref:Myb/SANT-like DNA-binding domain-containing protein n=1 Tax=Chelonia mydas TaxID=8469 RepID=M7BW14_CHEMY|nr:hypothetical protein UY3_01395 [Chelonia mydas]